MYPLPQREGEVSPNMLPPLNSLKAQLITSVNLKHLYFFSPFQAPALGFAKVFYWEGFGAMEFSVQLVHPF